MQKMKRKLELLRWHAYYDGWPLTIRRIALRGLAKAGLAKSDPATLQNSSDQKFDRRFRVHTRGVVETDQLHLPENRKEHAVEYLPTSAASLGWLLSRLPVSHSEYAFIDLGSGKGRMLLVASEFPFQQIEGVELSTELHQIAEQNIQNFRSRNIRCPNTRSLNQDATQYEFPNLPLILFLFNPFSAEVLIPVVEKLLTSLQADPRPVYVIYHNPQHSDVFDQTGLFQEGFEDLQPGTGWKSYTNNFTRFESRDSNLSPENNRPIVSQ